jgi:hypothetical protein
VCDSTYVNGHRRKFFEKIFSALSRLDDAKGKSKITALPSAGSRTIFQKLADANHATIEKKGARPNPTCPQLNRRRKSREKYTSALAEWTEQGVADLPEVVTTLLVFAPFGHLAVNIKGIDERIEVGAIIAHRRKVEVFTPYDPLK